MNKQIAYELGICEDTVKEHVSKAVRTGKFKTVTQLIVHLVRLDLL